MLYMIFKYCWQPVLIQRILFGFEVIRRRSWLKNHFRESFLAKQSIQNKRRNIILKKSNKYMLFCITFFKNKIVGFLKVKERFKTIFVGVRYLHPPNSNRTCNFKNIPPLKNNSLILKTWKEKRGWLTPPLSSNAHKGL